MEDIQYQLNIADILWSVIMPYEVEVGENCIPFFTESERFDYRIKFAVGKPDSFGETLSREQSPIVWKGPNYFRVERTFATALKPQTSVILREEDPSFVEGFIYPGSEKHVQRMEKVLDASEVESLLSHKEAIILHSALVRHEEQAILFTAPSGTGKSTQAELWEKYRGAVQLNGDRSIIRKTNGAWRAYGSPFAGTSGIYRNESAPVKAIIVLRRGEKNLVESISRAEAFRCLYSETVIPRWNDKAHYQIMDIITRITEEIPVYRYLCTPTEEAVDYLDHFLHEESMHDRRT